MELSTVNRSDDRLHRPGTLLLGTFGAGICEKALVGPSFSFLCLGCILYHGRSLLSFVTLTPLGRSYPLLDRGSAVEAGTRNTPLLCSHVLILHSREDGCSPATHSG